MDEWHIEPMSMENGPLAERVRTLWQQGLDTHQIADQLKVAESWVYYVLHRLREARRAA